MEDRAIEQRLDYLIASMTIREMVELKEKLSGVERTRWELIISIAKSRKTHTAQRA